MNEAIGKLVVALSMFLLVLVVVAGLSVLMAFPSKWLINYLFTSQLLLFVFGVSKVTVWQALAVNLLTGGIFRGTSSVGQAFKKEKK